MNIDLHIHTTASDGTLSPTQVVEEAARAGLEVIAIADHDTTEGVSEALEAQERNRIVVIPGVEVSAEAPGEEVHILGYWMDYKDPAFQSFLERPRSARPGRIEEMCKKLSGLGVSVTPEEVFRLAGNKGSVGRAHLARVLLEKGYVKEMEEAFQRYLSKGAPAYVKRIKNTTSDALSMIHGCGGISVIAHPGLLEDLKIIDLLIREGVMGIEAYCHEHNKEQAEQFSRLARENDLLVTGGSDYHGTMLDKTFSLGDLQVPYECYLQLKETKDRLST